MSFLMQLGFMRVGQPYELAHMQPVEQDIAAHMMQLGLLMPFQVSGRRRLAKQPTHAAGGRRVGRVRGASQQSATARRCTRPLRPASEAACPGFAFACQGGCAAPALALGAPPAHGNSARLASAWQSTACVRVFRWARACTTAPRGWPARCARRAAPPRARPTPTLLAGEAAWRGKEDERGACWAWSARAKEHGQRRHCWRAGEAA